MSREVSATISSLTFPTPDLSSSSYQVDLEIFLEDPDLQDSALDQDEDDTMKVAPPTYKDSPSKSFLLPLLEDPEEGKLTKENSLKFMLRCVPANDDPKYQCQIRILTGNETVRQVLRWRKDVTRLPGGLNIGDVQELVPVLETLMGAITAANFHSYMVGDDTHRATQRYNAAMAAAADAAARTVIRNQGISHYYHMDDVADALNWVVTCALPHKVLARVKRSLRRDMRKPADMTIRKYWSCLTNINVEEIACLPPFGNSQHLSPDEMIDIVLYGSPKSWSKELERQGVDPYAITPQALIGHLENIESSEDFDPNAKTTSKKKASTSKSKDSSKKSGDFFCLLHGKNHTHDTDDCTKLKSEAKRLKGDGKTKSSGKDSGKKSNWKKKASDASDKAKSEISALVKKSVKQAVKDLKAVDKKRKSKSDSDNEDLNVIDNLDEFNYATSKLNLDDNSDTESEVSA